MIVFCIGCHINVLSACILISNLILHSTVNGNPYIKIKRKGQGVLYHKKPPELDEERFNDTKHYDELFFVKRSYADFIQGMKERKQINHPKVEALFYQVRRADFFNKKPVKGFCNIPYAFANQVVMELPSYVAVVLELMVDHIKNGSRVLDIGSGQGYITTCLAHLVGSTGKVIGLEHDIVTVNQSLKNIKFSSPELLERKTIEIIEKDGRWGHAEGGPYDVIFYGAGTPEVSTTIMSQLKPKGRIVAPVGTVWRQNLSVIDKNTDGSYKSQVIKRVSLDYLHDLEFQLHPEMKSAPINESVENYTKVFPPPPGTRVRDIIHPLDYTFGESATGPYPEMYLDDSVDERRIYPQKVLDLLYGVNKTKSLHR